MSSSLCIAALFFLSLTACTSTEPFEYCSHLDRLENIEFQVNLLMEPFAGYSSAEILSVRAEALFENFITVSSIVVNKPYEESVFKETDWFLTQPDGMPLETDSAIDVPYNEMCYIRMRDKIKLKHGEKDERKLSAALKIRGIDLETFEQPDIDGIEESIDCDVHPDLHTATYKATAKTLKSTVRFDKFGDVLELFPVAGLVFHLNRRNDLPVRDAFVTHRFKWKEVMFDGVEIECSLDLRFHDEEMAYAGFAPHKGEFSCSANLKEVEKEYKDVGVFLESLRSVFIQFHLLSPWILSEYVI